MPSGMRIVLSNVFSFKIGVDINSSPSMNYDFITVSSITLISSKSINNGDINYVLYYSYIIHLYIYLNNAYLNFIFLNADI